VGTAPGLVVPELLVEAVAVVGVVDMAIQNASFFGVKYTP
jgi:hypothetical protein